MIKIKEDIWYYRGYDIFHSPDEGGYYAAQGNAVSKIYKSRDAIRKVIDKNTIRWKPEAAGGKSRRARKGGRKEC